MAREKDGSTSRSPGTTAAATTTVSRATAAASTGRCSGWGRGDSLELHEAGAPTEQHLDAHQPSARPALRRTTDSHDDSVLFTPQAYPLVVSRENPIQPASEASRGTVVKGRSDGAGGDGAGGGSGSGGGGGGGGGAAADTGDAGGASSSGAAGGTGGAGGAGTIGGLGATANSVHSVADSDAATAVSSGSLRSWLFPGPIPSDATRHHSQIPGSLTDHLLPWPPLPLVSDDATVDSELLLLLLLMGDQQGPAAMEGGISTAACSAGAALELEPQEDIAGNWQPEDGTRGGHIRLAMLGAADNGNDAVIPAAASAAATVGASLTAGVPDALPHLHVPHHDDHLPEAGSGGSGRSNLQVCKNSISTLRSIPATNCQHLPAAYACASST